MGYVVGLIVIILLIIALIILVVRIVRNHNDCTFEEILAWTIAFALACGVPLYLKNYVEEHDRKNHIASIEYDIDMLNEQLDKTDDSDERKTILELLRKKMEEKWEYEHKN